MARVCLPLACLLYPLATTGFAQPAAPEVPPAAAGSRLQRSSDWPLESIRLADGQRWEGLILADSDEVFEFVQIHRPPGQPMRAVLRWPDPAQVVERNRLDDVAHQQLLQRYRAFKHRVGIELGQMQGLSLQRVEGESGPEHHYRGRWFQLTSTANEEMTRRCVVRMEQVVRAYRQLLPPRKDSHGSFGIRLHGSMDEYRGHLQRLELDLNNPAFYSISRNLIVAGSNLSHYAERLQHVRQANESLLRRYDQVLNPQFDEFLRQLGRRIQQQGGDTEEVTLRRLAWDAEYKAAVRRVDETNRRNEAKFADVTRQMFTRLYHEAFHAYLENHVYPHRDHHVPRWLNEGLAQVFEGGRLEADTLRIDSPDPERLQQLQAAFQQDPHPLAPLLASETSMDTAPHGSDYAPRQYLYSWGLAYYLTFQLDLLDQPRLDWYLSPQAARLPPVARFEKLVGMPADQFERQWRAHVTQ